MFKKLALVTALIAASTTAANAVTPASSDFCLFGIICFPTSPPDSGKKLKAPEIDPSSAVAGLTLLAGGLAVMLGRRSKRLQTQAE